MVSRRIKWASILNQELTEIGRLQNIKSGTTKNWYPTTCRCSLSLLVCGLTLQPRLEPELGVKLLAQPLGVLHKSAEPRGRESVCALIEPYTIGMSP